jgi:hypothetical protein
MPYALFSNAAKVSKPFRTKSEVWQYAERSGLVVEVASFEEDPPRRILDMGYVIRECGPDPQEISGPSREVSKHEIARSRPAKLQSGSAGSASDRALPF